MYKFNYKLNLINSLMAKLFSKKLKFKQLCYFCIQQKLQ